MCAVVDVAHGLKAFTAFFQTISELDRTGGCCLCPTHVYFSCVMKYRDMPAAWRAVCLAPPPASWTARACAVHACCPGCLHHRTTYRVPLGTAPDPCKLPLPAAAIVNTAVDPDTLPPPDIRGTLREAACGHVH